MKVNVVDWNPADAQDKVNLHSSLLKSINESTNVTTSPIDWTNEWDEVTMNKQGILTLLAATTIRNNSTETTCRSICHFDTKSIDSRPSDKVGCTVSNDWDDRTIVTDEREHSEMDQRICPCLEQIDEHRFSPNPVNYWSDSIDSDLWREIHCPSPSQTWLSAVFRELFSNLINSLLSGSTAISFSLHLLRWKQKLFFISNQWSDEWIRFSFFLSSLRFDFSLFYFPSGWWQRKMIKEERLPSCCWFY